MYTNMFLAREANPTHLTPHPPQKSHKTLTPQCLIRGTLCWKCEIGQTAKNTFLAREAKPIHTTTPKKTHTYTTPWHHNVLRGGNYVEDAIFYIMQNLYFWCARPTVSIWLPAPKNNKTLTPECFMKMELCWKWEFGHNAKNVFLVREANPIHLNPPNKIQDLDPSMSYKEENMLKMRNWTYCKNVFLAREANPIHLTPLPDPPSSKRKQRNKLTP